MDFDISIKGVFILDEKENFDKLKEQIEGCSSIVDFFNNNKNAFKNKNNNEINKEKENIQKIFSGNEQIGQYIEYTESNITAHKLENFDNKNENNEEDNEEDNEDKFKINPFFIPDNNNANNIDDNNNDKSEIDDDNERDLPKKYE